MRDYAFPGPVAKCVATLKNGHLLAILPGGARETLFATHRYEIMWNGRCGFARVAREVGVDIIPVFTRNIRHMFWTPEFVQRLARPLFERYNIPFVSMFGAFPVKLIPYVGTPIPCSSAQSDKELAEMVHKAM